VRDAIALRHADSRLFARADVDVVSTGAPFVFRRGGTLLVALNPSAQSHRVAVPADARVLLGSAVSLADGALDLAPFGCAVLDLS